nr:serine hydrolase domain-containing protein [Lewinella sp. JB7]
MIQRIDATTVSVDSLDARIRQLVEAADVAGLTVTIVQPDTVPYRRAFGYAHRSRGDTLRTDHVFYGASLSKAVFGYLVADLVEEGTIDLDRPLQEYFDVPIPELAFNREWRGFRDLADDPRYREITARMCLAHTSGLPNWRWISRVGEFAPEGKLRLYTDPGTVYSYSGEGMMLLQHAIEHVTGRGLEELARERIFDPLRMDMTSYVWQDRFGDAFSYGHLADGSVIPKDTEDEAGAAGSLETTPEDYAVFLQHVLRSTAAGSPLTERLFTPVIRIRSRMQFGPESLVNTTENDDIQLSYGLGWGILQTPYGKGVFKEGHGEGFQHYSILFPDRGIGVLLMANSDNAESIFRDLLALTVGDTYTPWRWENYLPYVTKGS